jgi:hypothetical protein
MREIKFRVWNKVLKKFDPAGLPIMHNSEKGIFGVDNSYVEHFVVQQYTMRGILLIITKNITTKKL